MRKFRKTALFLGTGALLLAGSMSLYSATPAEAFDAVWKSKAKADLDDATYVAVKRSPSDVLAIVKHAFTHADAKQEPEIVEAAIRALRDLELLRCELVNDIVNAGIVESDEDPERKYAIVDAAKLAAPSCVDALSGINIDGPGLSFSPTGVLGGANAAPVGGIGSPMTTETVLEPEQSGGNGGGGSANPGGGGDNTPGPGIVDPPPTQGTPTGENPV